MGILKEVLCHIFLSYSSVTSTPLPPSQSQLELSHFCALIFAPRGGRY